MKGPRWLVAIALALASAAACVVLTDLRLQKEPSSWMLTIGTPAEIEDSQDTLPDVNRSAGFARTSAPPELAVVVVHRDDGTPAADVDVFALACDRKLLEDPERAWFDLHWNRGDIEAVARRFGSKHRTDAQGVATVPDSPRLTHLAARSGGAVRVHRDEISS